MPNLNCCLLIFKALILSSRVDGGIPSLAAAPDGPETRPLVSASAASIIPRSVPGSVSARNACAAASAFRRPGPGELVKVLAMTDSQAPAVRALGAQARRKAKEEFEVELGCGVASVHLERGGEIPDRSLDLSGAAVAARRIEGKNALQRARL